MPEKKGIKPDTLYSSISQLIIHCESTTWNRLYNFLIAASILILSWSALYATHGSRCKWLLFVIGLVGAVLSFAWIWVGMRGRKYLHLYTKIAREIEREERLRYCFFTATENLSRGEKVYNTWLYKYYGKIKDGDGKKGFRYYFFWPIRVFSSRGLMWMVPLLFLFLFVFLIIVSFSITCN